RRSSDLSRLRPVGRLRHLLVDARRLGALVAARVVVRGIAGASDRRPCIGWQADIAAELLAERLLLLRQMIWRLSDGIARLGTEASRSNCYRAKQYGPHRDASSGPVAS